tara:strand:+ start:2965 stop:3273 length:309 start_codon:yes stop_codon:yes gene_type:complete
MAVTHTWTIETVERNLSDGGITTIHWRCTGVDGDHSASNYGTTNHTPDASDSGFIAYDSVTEANCIAWAQAALDKNAIETAIADDIGIQKTPTTGSGTPWAA